MNDYNNLEHFNFWCQKVLPLVYDDSLSYYELLCKVVEKINEMVDAYAPYGDTISDLKKEIEIIQNWIKNFDTSYAETIIKKYISTMIFVEITDGGYIVYNIPEEWHDINFSTTGLDEETDLQPEYGHLILSY